MAAWDQLSNEGSSAFGLFRVFLELGFDRTVELVAEQTGRHLKVVKKIARKFQWKPRSYAYDQFLANAELNAAKRKLERDAVKWVSRFGTLREQEYEMGQKLMARAKEMLAFPIMEQIIEETAGPIITDFETGNKIATKKVTVIVKPLKFTMKDIREYIETASKLCRMSMGKETERTLVNVDIFNSPDKNLNSARELYKRFSEEYADRPDVLEQLPQWLASSWGVEPKQLTEAVVDVDGEVVEPQLSSNAEQ